MRIVQKFGGTSMATPQRIQHVAEIIAQSKKSGHQVLVVVSAMAGVTQELLDLVTHFNASHMPNAESDAILSTGEQVSAALLSLALQSKGLQARSWMGWQIPIYTTYHNGQTRIQQVNMQALKDDLNDDVIPIIAGFQGFDAQTQRISTLPRGGSDLTAVYVAAACQADRCDIYKDVAGVYQVDPHLVRHAHVWPCLSYAYLLNFVQYGISVMHPDAVRYAEKMNVPIWIGSTFNALSPSSLAHGTYITHKECAQNCHGVMHISGIWTITTMNENEENDAVNTHHLMDIKTDMQLKKKALGFFYPHYYGKNSVLQQENITSLAAVRLIIIAPIQKTVLSRTSSVLYKKCLDVLVKNGFQIFNIGFDQNNLSIVLPATHLHNSINLIYDVLTVIT